jgi:uncharacterized membrane protein
MFRKASHLAIGLGTSAILGSSTFLISTFAFSSPAHAWFKVCNRSSETASVAFAYYDVDARRPTILGPAPPKLGRGWTSEGWWTLSSGQCAETFPHSIRERNRIYYLYAETSSDTWQGANQFCVLNDRASRFALGHADRVCGNGGERKPFKEIDAGNVKNYTYTLTN